MEERLREEFERHFEEIETKTRVAYAIAQEARKKGLDPAKKVEIGIASGLAEKATGIVSVLYPQVKDKKIEERIRELEKQYGFLELAVALKIAEEIAQQKYCKFSSQLEAIEAGLRVGVAYLTLGVVSSPIEGIVKIIVKKTLDGRDYLAVSYAGPIRSAGGTMAALSLVIADYLRMLFGYAKYDATELEAKRAITEIFDYHDWITNLQYMPSEEEVEHIVRNLPVEIEGEASEEREVSNYKDLPRISTNKIRSGFCLVLAEGLAAKANKVIKALKKAKEQGIDIYENWKFLEKLDKLKAKKQTEDVVAPMHTYIKDIVGGRPILSYPSRSGGFRLRYGRTRTSGYSAMAINPALTYIIENFLAFGTQLRTERPGKSCGLATCSSIEGPIVKLQDGSVVKINTVADAIKYKDKIQEIIYLGDILISYGDFYNRNHVLMPCGYVEEWWAAELKDAIRTKDISKEEKELIDRILHSYGFFDVGLEEAIKISLNYHIPLHPKYIFYWTQIDKLQFQKLIEWLEKGFFNQSGNFVLPYHKQIRAELNDAKRALELLGVEHIVAIENVLVKEKEAIALLLNLGLFEIDKNVEEKISKKIVKKENFVKLKELAKSLESGESGKKILDLINQVSEFKINDKAGSFIGARMGRPEKARPRSMATQPHVLFPVGDQGGRMRSFLEAIEVGYVEAELPTLFCENCNKETIYFVCEDCGKETAVKYYCQKCDKLYSESFCSHGSLKPFRKKRIDIRHYLEKAYESIKMNGKQELLIKGVHGTNSAEHVVEHLAKGILRAIYGLPVYKDGTIRYDATEIPLTHFKPREIGTSIEKLKQLGYNYDIDGKPLVDEDQLLVLKPHDVILPASKEAIDETADKFFLKVAQFVDDLLTKFYGMKPFYNAKSREDLIGQLLICIAPHNTAGTVARIIGFSNTQALLASPYLHAALRRDCDGDEAGFMLLLDALLNFSQKFLPSQRGGAQDTPLIINVRIKQNEVDDMIFDMENVKEFPTEFYYAAQCYKNPRELKDIKIRQVRDDLSSYDSLIINFTHPTALIDEGNKCSAYKKLVTMEEKVRKQMEIGEKIRAVDTTDLAALVITKHFMRDIRGNLRKFSTQQFRCSKCNEKYRRPPLKGLCIKCNNRLIFTVTEGGIKKYLSLALDLAKRYNVPDYLKQTLELTKASIDLIFVEETKQATLQKWIN
jgi:DNA polymerase II large subunit